MGRNKRIINHFRLFRFLRVFRVKKLATKDANILK